MKNIRIFLFATLAIIAMVSATMMYAPAAAAQSNRSEETFERILPLSSGGQFSVENYKGRIEIIASNQNQVKVDVKKYVVGSESSRQRWMRDVTVDFTQSSNHAGVRVRYPNHNCAFFCDDNDIDESGVELRIQVPRSVNLQIDGYKPDMLIRGTQGDLRINSYKSEMQIEHIQGPIHIETYKERIEMRDVDVQGRLYIKTYSGEVDADLTNIGTDVTLDTYKGDVTLRIPDRTGLDVDFSDGR